MSGYTIDTRTPPCLEYNEMVADLSRESKFPAARWSEFGNTIISSLELKKTAQGEYHGPCPSCAGKERFWIKEFQGEVMVNCGKCNDYKANKGRLRDMFP